MTRTLSAVAVFTLVMTTIAEAQVSTGDFSLVTVVPHSRWVARCSEPPVSAFDGVEVVESYQRPGGRAWVLRSGSRWGILVAYKMGDYSGVPVYIVHGPTALRDRMEADSAACPNVKAWSAVTDLPAAAVAWIAERSTCCGSATIGGMEYSQWPCSWQLEAGKVTVNRFDGYGPGIVAGTDPCEGYVQP